MSNVDGLAQLIRQVDGDHNMGAGALAEAIVESHWFSAELATAERRGAAKGSIRKV